MTTKLTLTIEEEVIQKAKKYASKKQRSLSKIVEAYLKSIAAKEPPERGSISAKIRKMQGAVSLPKNFDYKKEVQKELGKKYKL
jgi:hypothetical protein